MAIFRKISSSFSSSSSGRLSKDAVVDVEKVHTTSTTTSVAQGTCVTAGTSLRRELKARHISMIAIGGAIGTGLVVGTGAALARAGPGAILTSYTLAGILVWLTMCALGEMAAWLPIPSGFTGFAGRFVDPALGFALGYTYWFKSVVLTPSQLTAAAMVLEYWVPRERVNSGVWIAIFLIAIIAINIFGVRFFGEIEFWLSSIKVIVIVGLIILSLVLVLGGGPSHDRIGFRYWNNPGAFRPYIAAGATGQFLGVWSSMITAVFAYLGTELVGVTAGEAQNPRRNIPRAIKMTFWRIIIFYILSVFLLGLLIPYNSKLLIFANRQQSSSASASPFVVAIQIARIPALPSLINACILLFVFSAANSDLYIATRTIYGLAKEGDAPTFLAKTDKNDVPIAALALSSAFSLLAFMNVSSDAAVVFHYFVNLVSMFGLLTWITILVSHIYFIRARIAQCVPAESLPYRAPFGIWGSYIALGSCVLISLTKNFEVFTAGTFDYKNFITGYLGIPLYLGMILGYKWRYGTKEAKPNEADLWSEKEEIDREEAKYLTERAKEDEIRRQEGKRNWYMLVSWLF